MYVKCIYVHYVNSCYDVDGVKPQRYIHPFVQGLYNDHYVNSCYVYNCLRPQLLFSSFAMYIHSYIPSDETLVHSGAGKVYWPCLILFFIPGDIGAPPVL